MMFYKFFEMKLQRKIQCQSWIIDFYILFYIGFIIEVSFQKTKQNEQNIFDVQIWR